MTKYFLFAISSLFVVCPFFASLKDWDTNFKICESIAKGDAKANLIREVVV